MIIQPDPQAQWHAQMIYQQQMYHQQYFAHQQYMAQQHAHHTHVMNQQSPEQQHQHAPIVHEGGEGGHVEPIHDIAAGSEHSPITEQIMDEVGPVSKRPRIDDIEPPQEVNV